ncbi:WD40 repeat domain-containing protein [Dactylosporangium sp. CA-092794]|uniref:WD40 repeat domain-containing protein n=1 Tax=Dactylosporangium sp. CA-092794 TaxID=3239929 RepID=UPI003D929E86
MTLLLGTVGADPPLTQRPELTGNAGGTWLISSVDTPAGRVDEVVDAATGRAAFTVDTDTSGHEVSDVSPDGVWLARIEGRTVRIWDPVADRDRAHLPAHAYTRGAAFSPDGTMLVTRLLKVVQAWEIDTGRCLATVRINRANADALAIAPDGAWLAAVCSDRRVRILDVATARSRRVLSAEGLLSAAVEPGGAWLATGGLDGTVRLWDPGSGRQLAALPGHAGWAAAVAVSPDGTRLASAGTDGLVLIRDAATGATLATTRTPSPAVLRCRWLADGAGICVSARDGTAHVYRIPA